MNQKSIVEARKKAESAVEGMADPSLKLKAFEQIFAKLLDGADPSERPPIAGRRRSGRARTTAVASRPETLTGRLLALRDDGFFGSQRTLSDIREELGSRGFHYPLTTLSGVMQKLVRNRELRRERVKSGAKRTYKYANS
jgi:alkanesulfonate monooxygenase SsuD/methylene tetrahydromethanopterin reductase-like flavin-dependent oxidoreductase (luciferase family)